MKLMRAPRVELRKMSCDLGVLARADGSARYAHEGTSMLAAVSAKITRFHDSSSWMIQAYGPVEALAAEEQVLPYAFVSDVTNHQTC